MRRKQTQLETNLIELGYKLSHKTYYGKKSEKVDKYVFIKQNGHITYQVSIDRTREHICDYSFITDEIRRIMVVNDDSIEYLQEINNKFHEEMSYIYDFKGKHAHELENPFDEPFVEESVFDD